MNKQYVRYMQLSLTTLDLVVLNAGFFIDLFLLRSHALEDNFRLYSLFLLISNLVWVFVSVAFRIYTDKIIQVFEKFTKYTIQAYFAWVVFVLIYIIFTQQKEFSRLVLLFSICSFGLGLIINRFLYLSIRSYNKRRNSFLNKILIIGYNDTAKKLVHYFEEEGLNTKILGFIVDNNQNINQLTTYPLLQNIGECINYAKQMEANEIYSTISPEENHNIYDLMDDAEKACIRFKVVPNLSFFVNRNFHIDYFNDLPIISTRSIALDDVGNKVKKRILDIVVSSFVTVFILSWLVPIIAILIKLESPGPIFFPQLRTGLNRRDFMCLKFRSMKVNKDSDMKQATKGDSRVTKIGKFLRRTSLDEFPQFINVLKGEMSLVGPRPHMLKHTDDYSKIVDDYMVRQFLKPGITGWAQVNGFRGEIANQEQINMRVNKDIWYLENWTLWLDIKILFLTVYNVIKGDKNAY